MTPWGGEGGGWLVELARTTPLALGAINAVWMEVYWSIRRAALAQGNPPTAPSPALRDAFCGAVRWAGRNGLPLDVVRYVAVSVARDATEQEWVALLGALAGREGE